MNHIEVAVPTPLSRTFTYLADAPVPAGSRVLVPFGQRRLVGVALGPAKPPTGADADIELKHVESVIDASPVYSPQVLAVARWISTYYMHPLGEVLRTMLPASTTKVVKEACALTEAGAAARADGKTTPEARLLRHLYGKSKTEVTQTTLVAKLKKLAAGGSEDSRGWTLKELTKAGLVTRTRGSSMRARRGGKATTAMHTAETAAETAGVIGTAAAAKPADSVSAQTAGADADAATAGAVSSQTTAAGDDAGATPADSVSAQTAGADADAATAGAVSSQTTAAGDDAGATLADSVSAQTAGAHADAATPGSINGGAAAAVAPPPLTPAQQRAFDAIVSQGLAATTGAKVFLLHGVTGSGKTEVYLHLIAEAIRRDGGEAQALVLVPEISLTPQMTRVFEQRFPGAVAVVHSAMTDADRWAQLERVRSGAARILIGPRSAVFGPFRRLRLLLVDEEHDGSYKQATGLTYNGRDVAVLRGRLEDATVVLGSATPSMESYHNACSGRYVLLEMPERVSGRPLPSVEVLESERPQGRSGMLVGGRGHVGPDGTPLADDAAEIPIDPRILTALRANHAAGHQAIVLVNRRGYAYYLFSLAEKKAIQCPQCSISMTLHARSTVLRCHYCDYQTNVQKILRERPDDTFLAVGYGSQKAEEYLARQLPGVRLVRLDSDTLTQGDVLPRVLGDFRSGKIDVLVGTQILAKGHDFPNVTLIVVLEVDQLLGLPDFRAGERTFQLIVQAAGRAGRAELPGRVLIQTLRSSHPVVTSAIAQDYQAFAERELRFRQQLAYPPFARMIAFDFNSPDKPRLLQLCRRIEGWVEQMAAARPQLVAKVRVLGPSVPPIETIRGRHRRQLIFSSDQVDALRALVGHFVQAFQKLPGDLRMRIDVDPQSLV